MAILDGLLLQGGVALQHQNQQQQDQNWHRDPAL